MIENSPKSSEQFKCQTFYHYTCFSWNTELRVNLSLFILTDKLY